MNQLANKNFFLLIVLLCVLLSSCGLQEVQDGPPTGNINVSNIPNASPKILPRSSRGNPSSYVVFGKRYYVLNSSKGYHVRGIASWYGTKFNHRLTSSGEPYNMLAMTAANKVLPLPTFVRVTNLANGRQIIVKVNDRGPFKKNRVIDLSYVAAKKLGMLPTGTAYVDVRAIDPRVYLARHTQQPLNKPHARHPGHPLLFLQVAAFMEKTNADKLAQRLKTEFQLPIRIAENHHTRETIYKVQLGPIPSIQLSDNISSQLIHDGYGEPLAVIE
ncbi:MAG: septal ring lytic transglycosylase RlpA family protein [Pseudomonadota bacterium]